MTCIVGIEHGGKVLTDDCPGPHYTVLRGDLIEPPHVHEWVPVRFDGQEGGVRWCCRNCPDHDANNPHSYATTQAPKPMEAPNDPTNPKGN